MGQEDIAKEQSIVDFATQQELDAYYKELHYSSYALFEPSDKDVFVEYPELKLIEEFKKLKNSEMKFVAMVGSRTSSLFISNINDSSDRQKIAIAVEKSFGNSITAERKKKLITGTIDDHLLVAIEKMKNFEPSTRMQSKMMVEKIFARWVKIIEKHSIEDDSYVKVTSSIIDKLPNLIELKENAFGVRVKAKSSKPSANVNLMDSLLNEEDD